MAPSDAPKKLASSHQETALPLIEAATETRGSCPGLKRSPHTSRQPGYEGDAFLKLHAALTAGAGFPERAWEVMV